MGGNWTLGGAGGVSFHNSPASVQWKSYGSARHPRHPIAADVRKLASRASA